MAGRGKGLADEARKADRALEKAPEKAPEKTLVAARKRTGAGGVFTPGVFLLGVAVLFIATMGSAFLAVTFLGQTVGWQKDAAPAVQEAKGTAEFGPAVEVGNFTVNLGGQGERFLKAGVAVEVSGAEAGVELTSRTPQLKDIVISVLSTKTMAEVANPEGREAVKKEIRDRINRLLTKGRVRSVFFTEFVFQ